MGQFGDVTARNLVVLGAGAPHRGDTPVVLQETNHGVQVLEWILSAVGLDVDQVLFVSGHGAEQVRKQYPRLNLVHNEQWQTTGSGFSLLLTPLDGKECLTVSYGDILFRSGVVAKLSTASYDVTLAWDSHWQSRFGRRGESDLKRCEKVVVLNSDVVRLGSDIPVEWASGEFIGLVHFSRHGLEALRTVQANLPSFLHKAHLSSLLEYLRSQGVKIGAVDVGGDWAEVNEPRDIAHFVLGTKAETLDRLHRMVTQSTIQAQVSFTVEQWANSSSHVMAKISESFPKDSLVVRSSALGEDSFASSHAGAFKSVLDVDHASLRSAIDEVIESYSSRNGLHQVLVQPMLRDVQRSGVVFTRTLESGAPWIVVNYEENGSTCGITSGESDNHKTLYVWRQSSGQLGLIDWQHKLLDAVAEVERLLCHDALDIEFAQGSNGNIHVLQVRPIAAHQSTPHDDAKFEHVLVDALAQWDKLQNSPPHLPEARSMYGIMPDWNPAEIIGTRPKPLAESLYRYLIMDDVWATQRAEYGYRDVRTSPLLVNFAGRPYVDVRASFASFLPANLDEQLSGRLLRFYLDRLAAKPELHDKVEFAIVPTCYSFNFAKWEKTLGENGAFSDSEIKLLRRGLFQITNQGLKRVSEDLEKVATLSDRLRDLENRSDLSHLQRAYLMLEDCKRYGTLPFSHLARSGFVSMSLLKEAVEVGILSPSGMQSFLMTLSTVSSDCLRDAELVKNGKLAESEFFSKYGHLRPGTYDITSDRYDAKPEVYLKPIIDCGKSTLHGHEISDDAWRREKEAFFKALRDLGYDLDDAEIEKFLRNAIEGREYAKFVFTRGVSDALEMFARFGSGLGLSREDVAFIPVSVFLQIRDGQFCPQKGDDAYLRNVIERHQSYYEITSSMELPPLMTQKEDLLVFELSTDTPNFIGSQRMVKEVIEIDDLGHVDQLALEGKVALIPQADPGYDWLFSRQIAGLVTMYGGANSHMAIRSAEMGLTAAIGVGEQRYRELVKASVIEIDPSNQILRVIR